MIARIWRGYAKQGHADAILWDSIESVKAVAGADHETAVVPEERRQHLSR
jgi:hypothetical protein